MPMKVQTIPPIRAEAFNPEIGRALQKGRASEHLIVLENPSQTEIDAALLIRFGKQIPIGRRSSTVFRQLLMDRLGEVILASSHDVVITSMPERHGVTRKHTFVAFVEDLARDLAIPCVNNRFRERCARTDVSDIPARDRVRLLENIWEFRGSLEGRVAILLDDVYDSGASLDVATKVLAAAGATVIPMALVQLTDEGFETERVVHSYFGQDCASLLDVPDIQGSLRRSIVRWSRDPAWQAGCRV